VPTIKRIDHADGTTKYRFVVDVGTKPDPKRPGRMMRDQRTHTFDRLKDARAELARITHEVKGGTYVRPNRKMTVETYVQQWLASKASKKPATVRCYHDALKPVVER
jgi:hypothetical protein